MSSSITVTDYAFDAFISYSHSPVIKPWVDQYLHPYLRDWLTQTLGGHSARVFVDTEGIQPGARWPQRLRNTLLASKCLVPIYSPDYFQKPWCVSEFKSFVERERVLGLDITDNSLIIPIVHNDGDWFPPAATMYQMIDFSGCRTTSENFQNHANFPLFEQKVEELAGAVANVVRHAPSFNPDWPIVESEIERDVIVPMLRI